MSGDLPSTDWQDTVRVADPAGNASSKPLGVAEGRELFMFAAKRVVDAASMRRSSVMTTGGLRRGRVHARLPAGHHEDSFEDGVGGIQILILQICLSYQMKFPFL